MEHMVAHSPFVEAIGILLMAGICAVVVLNRLGFSPVLGYLAAGLVIGPGGFGWVEHSHLIRAVAEFGVVFLMFAIGLELSFERLRTLRADVFGLGGLQLIGTMAVVGGVTYLWTDNVTAALVVGSSLALSSTAVVLKVLSERSEIGTRVGRKAFAILLLQDLAVVPILLMVQILAGGDGTSSGGAFLALAEGMGLLVAATVLGRVLLRPLYRAVARTKSAELFVAVVILTVGGFAYVSEVSGFSLALGAFLAGLLVAETEFRRQVEMDVEPFKGLLLGLFFMAVGMGLDARFLMDNVWIILAIVLGIFALKGLVVFGLGLAFRLSLGESVWLALLLAQIGEFAFVTLGLAGTLQIMPQDTLQKLLAATGVSLAITPLLASAGARLQRVIDGAQTAQRAPALEESGEKLDGHVIIAGYGRVGQAVARLLDQQRISYVALDLNADRVSAAFQQGYPVFYGNAARPDVLKSAGVARATALVITLDDPQAAERTVQAVRGLAPHLPILARARDAEHCRALSRSGATGTVLEAMEGSLQLASRLLETLGTPSDVAAHTIATLRQEDYQQILDPSDKKS